jgi:hypothetical protein
MLEAFACSELPRDVKLVMVSVQDMETRQLADQMGIGRSVGSVSDNELPATVERARFGTREALFLGDSSRTGSFCSNGRCLS